MQGILLKISFLELRKSNRFVYILKNYRKNINIVWASFRVVCERLNYYCCEYSADFDWRGLKKAANFQPLWPRTKTAKRRICGHPKGTSSLFFVSSSCIASPLIMFVKSSDTKSFHLLRPTGGPSTCCCYQESQSDCSEFYKLFQLFFSPYLSSLKFPFPSLKISLLHIVNYPVSQTAERPPRTADDGALLRLQSQLAQMQQQNRDLATAEKVKMCIRMWWNAEKNLEKTVSEMNVFRLLGNVLNRTKMLSSVVFRIRSLPGFSQEILMMLDDR